MSKGRTGCVRFATRLSTWMSSISCLFAQLIIKVMSDKSMPAIFNRPFLSQTFSLSLNQMHVVVFSESVFHLTYHSVTFPVAAAVPPAPLAAIRSAAVPSRMTKGKSRGAPGCTFPVKPPKHRYRATDTGPKSLLPFIANSAASCLGGRSRPHSVLIRDD